MSKVYADLTNQQVVDFKGLVLTLNFYIIQNAAFSNHTAVSELVNQLDNLMDPYKDTKYEEELEKIREVSAGSTETPNQLRSVQRAIDRQKVNEKHKALMRLAYRKRFLPSASTGTGGVEFEQ